MSETIMFYSHNKKHVGSYIKLNFIPTLPFLMGINDGWMLMV